MATKVAIVDDDAETLDLLQSWLVRAGYETAIARDGISGLRLVRKFQPSLVILDGLMPGMDGWTLCRRIRETWNGPVIMLTVKTTTEDRLLGFDSGCDDYIAKPFCFEEVLARVRALLRRAGANNQRAAQVALDGGRVQVDLDSHQVTANGRRIYLTPTEFFMLACLVRNRGRVITHSELIKAAWTESDGSGQEVACVPSRGAAKVYISYLREKLGDDAKAPRIIDTVPAVGYRLADG